MEAASALFFFEGVCVSCNGKMLHALTVKLVSSYQALRTRKSWSCSEWIFFLRFFEWHFLEISASVAHESIDKNMRTCKSTTFLESFQIVATSRTCRIIHSAGNFRNVAFCDLAPEMIERKKTPLSDSHPESCAKLNFKHLSVSAFTPLPLLFVDFLQHLIFCDIPTTFFLPLAPVAFLAPLALLQRTLPFPAEIPDPKIKRRSWLFASPLWLGCPESRMQNNCVPCLTFCFLFFWFLLQKKKDSCLPNFTGVCQATQGKSWNAVIRKQTREYEACTNHIQKSDFQKTICPPRDIQWSWSASGSFSLSHVRTAKLRDGGSTTKHLEQEKSCERTVDGRNPAPPKMYETL